MIDYSQHPTATDLQNWILGTGLVEDFTDAAVASVDYASAILAARRDWERATGYRMGFRSDGTNKTVSIHGWDVPWNGVVQLPTGLISLTSLTIGGVAATSGTDYALDPANAPLEGEPYKSLILWRPVCPEPNTVQADGIWGFATEYPPDVWLMIVLKGVQYCFPQYGLQISGGDAALKAGPITLDFVRSSNGRGTTAGPLGQETDTVQTWWDRKVREYRF